MKRTGMIILGIIVCVSMVFAMRQENPQQRLTTNKEVVLKAGTNQIVPLHQIMQPNVQIRGEMAADGIIEAKGPAGTGEVNISRDCDGDCWNLQHVGEDTQWYLGSGAAADTFALSFQGAVPCIVEEAYIKWYNGGNVTVFGAMCSDDAVAATNGTCAAINENDGLTFSRSQADFSPIGELMTNPTPNTIDDYTPDWTLSLDIGGSFVVGDSTDLSDNPPFVIVFVKGADEPNPLAADVFTGMAYTWFGGPWTQDGTWGEYTWGSYQSDASIANGVIDIAAQVRVRYPWGAPIAANPYALCNTYASTDTRTVMVDFYDDVDEDTGVGLGDTDMVNFIWMVDGVEQPVMTLADAVPIDITADGNGLYGFDISYVAAPGSEISYYLDMVDNMGLESTTDMVSFNVLAPVNPDADLLFIGDHSHQYYVNQFEDIADGLGIAYEVWNVLDNVGIDYSVINWGWSNIFVYGWGNETVPVIAGEDDPGYADFLAGGGNLMFSDMDWFYGHNLDPAPTELVFEAGDPAFDWFGISGGLNDPDDDDNSDNGGAGDTTIVSLLPGLPEQFFLNNGAYGTLNWTDFLYPGDATAIFQGFDTEEVVGTYYEMGGSKRVMMSFMLDAIVDTTELGEVYYLQEMADIVAYFFEDFGVRSPAIVAIETGPTDIVYNDPGQDVTVMGSDANGDEFTVDLYYTVNGGEEMMIAMDNIGDGMFSASIPAQAGGSTVVYWPVSSDVDGSYAGDPWEYFVYAPASDVLFVLNNEMDPADYPGMYYFYWAAEGTLWVWPDFWVGEVNAELISYYDIIFEVNTTGTWADLYDHYGIIADWLAMGDKNFFVAGDELFGMFTGWTDTDYMEGDFWYDMGVAHVYNDIGIGGISPIYAEEGNMLSGALYDAAMAGGMELMYDPEYEIGITNYLDGFDAAPGAMPFLWDTASDLPIGIYKEWDNGSKTVIMGADPLSINSEPYEWWGATPEGPTIASYEWFAGGCDCLPGDVDGNVSVDILDIVMIVGYILGTTEFDECQVICGDANGDGNLDILDVVLIVSWILGNRADIATEATILQDGNAVSLDANGWVGGVQMTLNHGEEFTLSLNSDALVSDYVTEGTTTTLLIVNPGSDLFTADSGFEISEVIVATTDGYIEAAVNVPYEFALNPAYPNPFNPTTNISFAMPMAADVSVVVFDMLGRQVAELASGNYEAGYYTVTWDASSLSSGMYFITLTSREFNATQKVMLVK